MDARRANDRIAEKAEQLRFVSRVPMLCECGASRCRTVVLIGLGDYRNLRRTVGSYLTAPGHDLSGAELQERTPSYDIRCVTRAGRESDGDRWSA